MNNGIYMNFSCWSQEERARNRQGTVRILNEFIELLKQEERQSVQLKNMRRIKQLAPIVQFLDANETGRKTLMHVGENLLKLSEVIEELISPVEMRGIFGVKESEVRKALQKWQVMQIARGKPSVSFIEFMVGSLKGWVPEQFRRAIDAYKTNIKVNTVK